MCRLEKSIWETRIERWTIDAGIGAAMVTSVTEMLKTSSSSLQQD